VVESSFEPFDSCISRLNLRMYPGSNYSMPLENSEVDTELDTSGLGRLPADYTFFFRVLNCCTIDKKVAILVILDKVLCTSFYWISSILFRGILSSRFLVIQGCISARLASYLCKLANLQSLVMKSLANLNS
jgi:hypothetical protein